MASTSSINSAADTFASLNPKAAVKSTEEDPQDRFLKLYVTQLKNQDPLNPLDNAQVTSQLAQLNTVKGIENLNSTLNKLVDFFAGQQTMQASAMIGKSVLVPGAQLQLQNGIAVGGVELKDAVDQLKVKITDANGLLVRTLDLGAVEAGSNAFAWDGKTDAGQPAVNGTYKIAVEGVLAGKAVGATPLELGTVDAVVRSGTGFQLDLGKSGTVSFDDVRQIL